MTVTVAPGDFCKVTNTGDEPIVFQWNSRKYPVDPGAEVFVPFEAMANALGDPRAGSAMRSYKDESGNVGFIMDRATEVRRLRVLYDNQTGPEDQILKAPSASVTDLEGNPITTVLDDPSGETVHPVQQTAFDRDSLMAQLQRQQRMIELLAAQQGVDLDNPNLAAQDIVEPTANPDNPDEFITEPLTVPEDGGSGGK